MYRRNAAWRWRPIKLRWIRVPYYAIFGLFAWNLPIEIGFTEAAAGGCCDVTYRMIGASGSYAAISILHRVVSAAEPREHARAQ